MGVVHLLCVQPGVHLRNVFASVSGQRSIATSCNQRQRKAQSFVKRGGESARERQCPSRRDPDSIHTMLWQLPSALDQLCEAHPVLLQTCHLQPVTRSVPQRRSLYRHLIRVDIPTRTDMPGQPPHDLAGAQCQAAVKASWEHPTRQQTDLCARGTVLGRLAAERAGRAACAELPWLTWLSMVCRGAANDVPLSCQWCAFELSMVCQGVRRVVCTSSLVSGW